MNLDIDYTSENLVIVAYPSYSGGKFLINALSMADNACLQHEILASLQLQGKFTQSDKKEFLVSRLRASKFFWDDCGLGCFNLFGMRPEFLRTENSWGQRIVKSKLLKELIDSKINCFKATHDARLLKPIVNRWPNVRIVQMVNSWPLVEKRLGTIYTRNDINLTERRFTDEIKTLFKQAHQWNTTWFEDKLEFLAQVENLYDQLRLTNFNPNVLTEIRDEYLQAWESSSYHFKTINDLYPSTQL